MTIKHTIAVSALALGLCMAAPAYAQQTSNSQAGAIGLVATATNTSTDLNTQDSNNDNSTDISDVGNTDIADSGNTSDSGNTALMFALGSFNTDNSDNSTNDSNNGNDSSSIVADQDLRANASVNAPILFLSLASDNSSGDNSVSGSAFAAYAGILNTAWNTGISSNAQAATNVAARGSVTFGN
jgi:hypothetical protein